MHSSRPRGESFDRFRSGSDCAGGVVEQGVDTDNGPSQEPPAIKYTLPRNSEEVSVAASLGPRKLDRQPPSYGACKSLSACMGDHESG